MANIDLQIAAYFESEAARLVVSPADTAYAVAVNRIADDDGAAFRTWLAGADDMVRTAIRTAYEGRAAKNLGVHREKMAAAREVFLVQRAEGASKTKALKAAQTVYSRFTLKDVPYNFSR